VLTCASTVCGIAGVSEFGELHGSTCMHACAYDGDNDDVWCRLQQPDVCQLQQLHWCESGYCKSRM